MTLTNKRAEADIIQAEHENVADAHRVLPVDVAGNILDANLIKFDASDAQPNYIGVNSDADALDGDTDWLIYKFTYSGSDVTIIQKKVGSWTGRVALF